jgi:hypothetical protein
MRNKKQNDNDDQVLYHLIAMIDMSCYLKHAMSKASFNCSQCGEFFKSMSELDRHNQEQHKQRS